MPCRSRPESRPWNRCRAASLPTVAVALVLAACVPLREPAPAAQTGLAAATAASAGTASAAGAAGGASSAAQLPAGGANSTGGSVAGGAASTSTPPGREASDAAARRLLAYHEQLRRMGSMEVVAEIARLQGLLAAAPEEQTPAWTLELALALLLNRQGGDLQRALTLVEPIARMPNVQQQPWQPMARLLYARLVEQRRQEEQLERQAAQLRDSQRQVQQLQDKLEALKAIERNLLQRSPGLPASPAVPGRP